MKRIATLCLLLPLAAFAAPPSTSSSAAAASTTGTSVQVDELRTQMDALARRMAELSVKIGNQASANALRYLSDSRQGMLGIAARHDADGLHVSAVTPGSPAERAGLQVGDVITAVDGKSARSTDDAAGLPDFEAGKPVRLTVLRDGKALHVTATPQRWQGDWQATVREAERAAQRATDRVNSPEFREDIRRRIEAAVRESAKARAEAVKNVQRLRVVNGKWEISWWGLNLASLNPGLGSYFGTEDGALVLSRDAKRYPDLEPGDVITRVGDQAIARPADAMRAFGNAPDDKPLAVTVRRHGKLVKLAFKAPPRWLVVPPPPPPPPAPKAPRAPAVPTVTPPAPPPAPSVPPTPETPPSPPHPSGDR